MKKKTNDPSLLIYYTDRPGHTRAKTPSMGLVLWFMGLTRGRVIKDPEPFKVYVDHSRSCPGTDDSMFLPAMQDAIRRKFGTAPDFDRRLHSVEEISLIFLQWLEEHGDIQELIINPTAEQELDAVRMMLKGDTHAP